jgi:hypothetical protein
MMMTLRGAVGGEKTLRWAAGEMDPPRSLRPIAIHVINHSEHEWTLHLGKKYASDVCTHAQQISKKRAIYIYLYSTFFRCLLCMGTHVGWLV